MNALRYRLALMTLILFFSAISNQAVFAQQAPNANGTPVHMIVTVEPRKGSEATAVNREDVMVFEGKERAQVTEWAPAQGDHAGLEFFVLIDEGASFAVNTQLEDIRNFITMLPPKSSKNQPLIMLLPRRPCGCRRVILRRGPARIFLSATW